jgi:hypothetical protein
MPIGRKPLRIPITIALVGDEYTGRIYVGSHRDPVDVILDTGSSTLAVSHTVYDPRSDRNARLTTLAQAVSYDDETSWSGSVVRTNVAMTADGRKVDLHGAAVAVVYHQHNDVFGKARGILGLAYQQLNDAIDVGVRTIPPRFSHNQYQSGTKVFLEPYFTQLEQSGLEPDKFAFLTRRSVACVATNPATDSINEGILILGGGEEATDLYRGRFQVAKVVSDEFYDVVLKCVIVGDRDPIYVPAPLRGSAARSTAIVDSGTNGLDLAPTLFETILRRMTREQAVQMRKRIQLHAEIRYSEWPTIEFVLEGMQRDVRLQLGPENYWQQDAWAKGEVYRTLWRGTSEQSTLGLPLLNRYFTVFDGAANHGLGVVKFARAK